MGNINFLIPYFLFSNLCSSLLAINCSKYIRINALGWKVSGVEVCFVKEIK